MKNNNVNAIYNKYVDSQKRYNCMGNYKKYKYIQGVTKGNSLYIQNYKSNAIYNKYIGNYRKYKYTQE